MPRVAAPKVSQSEQSARFVEAARELGCDESEERFIEMVKKLASAPPVRNAPSKAKKPQSD